MVEVTSPSELAAVAERLRGLVAGIDPAWVTPREAPGLWSRLEDIRRLASGSQVVLSELVDRSDAPEKAGLRNGAEWIAQRSGGSLRSAYDAVATAKRLGDLPSVTAALQDGRVSAVQATVIADAAAVDPSAAERLVDLAQKASLGELRREALRIKAAADPDPDKTEDRIRRERRLRWFVDNEGAFNLSGRGPLGQGGELSTVLAPIIDDIFAAAHEAGITEPRDAYTWDALVEMARMAWAYMHGRTADHTSDENTDTAMEAGPGVEAGAGDGETDSPTATEADDGTPSGQHRTAAEPSEPRQTDMFDDAGVPPAPVKVPLKRRRKNGVNPWVRMSIRVEHAALVRGWVEGEETCDVAGLGSIPVRVARELLGEATLYLLVTKGRDVATVAHIGRGQNAAQKIASSFTQPECQREGCHRPVAEWDHREPYALNRVTEIGNIDGLCSPDHWLKTNRDWQLVDGVGKRPMVSPDDPRHPKNQGSRPRDKPDRNPIAA